ncbi:MAG: ATP-binding cassette domain-containing protein [Acidobacteriota bacterium]|nr:ATP-binding cassette domain-containing protein [Acidobacteriota bacterium]
MPPEALLLQGQGIEKRYGGVVALSQVQIRLYRGEILGLVGPNGAGKTTLVDVISGTQRANAGSLELLGNRLHGPASRRSRLGLARTFQYPQLALDLTVEQNLMVGRVAGRHRSAFGMITSAFLGAFWRADPEDGRVVRAIADELGLDHLERMTRDLTLGEQRLLEVGRALAQEPLVMLLDEPFAGSDASGVAGIADVIRTVQERGHGIILVDHNVDLVSSLADRMMLIDRGTVAFDGDPSDCIASPEMRQVYFGSEDIHRAT